MKPERLSLILLMFGLAACKSQSTANLETCEDPRPQICTMIYAPVCAADDQGSRKTYASGCNACADATVVGYEKGDCEELQR